MWTRKVRFDSYFIGREDVLFLLAALLIAVTWLIASLVNVVVPKYRKELSERGSESNTITDFNCG